MRYLYAWVGIVPEERKGYLVLVTDQIKVTSFLLPGPNKIEVVTSFSLLGFSKIVMVTLFSLLDFKKK
jgi:hypothetical protein